MDPSTLSSSVQEDGSILINSGPRLTIENTIEFARLIREGLADAKSKSVAVQFDPDLEVDITALQVLCSACKTAATMGKAFSCQGERPKALTELVAAAGAERHGGCKQNNDGPCLWFGGGK